MTHQALTNNIADIFATEEEEQAATIFAQDINIADCDFDMDDEEDCFEAAPEAPKALNNDFAAQVQAAAKKAVGFGKKAFVGSIYEVGNFNMSLDSFKAEILKANREGTLQLRRHDLMAALNADQLRVCLKGEIRYMGATMHSIIID